MGHLGLMRGTELTDSTGNQIPVHNKGCSRDRSVKCPPALHQAGTQRTRQHPQPSVSGTFQSHRHTGTLPQSKKKLVKKRFVISYQPAELPCFNCDRMSPPRAVLQCFSLLLCFIYYLKPGDHKSHF